jgi:hypothetical protein
MGGGRGGSLSLSSYSLHFLLKSRAGGGKCPEEEHTTCSGGPTIIIVTSAVYGEREYFIFYKI